MTGQIQLLIEVCSPRLLCWTVPLHGQQVESAHAWHMANKDVARLRCAQVLACKSELACQQDCASTVWCKRNGKPLIHCLSVFLNLQHCAHRMKGCLSSLTKGDCQE